MLTKIIRSLSFFLALLLVLSLAGCGFGPLNKMLSSPPHFEGRWIAYTGYTLDNVKNQMDTPVFTLSLIAKNDAKTIYTADLTAYNYQFTTPNNQPAIQSIQMVGDIKEAHLDFSTALVKLVSVKDLPGSIDESNPNLIKLNLENSPASNILYDPKTDTLQCMDQTFKRMDQGNSLQATLDHYKQDVKAATDKYLEEVGNAADPKTKFIVTYTFTDDLLKGQE